MIEEIAEDLKAERAYEDMLARPETVVDAFDLFGTIPTCSSCSKSDNSVDDVGSAGVCATCSTIVVERMCIRCGVLPPSHPKLDHCAACWRLELDERTAKLQHEHPGIGRRRPGLRDRRYNG
jgi:hypothetical protein